MKYLSIVRFLFCAGVVLNSLQHAQASENPFLRFNSQAVNGTLSKSQTFSQIGQITEALRGNGDLMQIPDFPTFTKLRLGLSLNGFVVDGSDRSRITDKLASEKIPEIMRALDKEGLLEESVKLSKVFQIDPLHILGPIVGENTFD